MKPSFLVFCSGVIFGVGLAVSGMLNPSKVVGFLDLFGEWDPSLAFVMGGGMVVNFIGFRLITRHGKPLFAPRFMLPSKTDIEMPLVIGAAIFGVGWAMAGLCPALRSRRFCSIQPMECFSWASCVRALARVACWRAGWTDENLFQVTDFSPMLRL